MAHGTVMGRASGGCMHEELVMAEGILCTMDGELSMHGRPTVSGSGTVVPYCFFGILRLLLICFVCACLALHCGFFSQQTLA